ncbi:MAG: cellulase family glycosylhydrolase [Prolixibacteraceae bacterium]|nr:cellulase family glycosylhydrolase [Prolixibacteraceae bacterium]
MSFFNAMYNAEFNRDSELRRDYLRKFKSSGINVLRIWCQWDNGRGFIDGGPGKTLYNDDGLLKPELLERLKEIVRDADEEEMVILLVLFSRESWNENIRLSDDASDRLRFGCNS